MDNILISVIVPVYNLEKYLARCLDSLLCQTYKNIEIVVINDGSADNSKSIIDEYALKYNNIIAIHCENGGVSSARNKGIDNATGDFIGFVDGDDTVEPNMFEILASNATRCNADISHCGYKQIKPNGEEVLFYGTDKIVEQNNEKGLFDLINGEYIEPGLCNKIFRRELFENLRFDTNLKNNEDLLLNVQLFNKAQLSVFEDKALYNYLLRENSASTSAVNQNQINNPLTVSSKIYEMFKNNIGLKDVAFKKLICSNINIYNLILKSNIDNTQATKNKIKALLKENLKQIQQNSYIPNKYKTIAKIITLCPTVYKTIYKISK